MKNVRKRFLSALLALALVLALVPMTAAADGITTATDLQNALNAAASATGSGTKVVTLTQNITVTDSGLTEYGDSAIKVPAGVTLDGAGQYSIIAENWTSSSRYHVVGVSGADKDTTIQNLTIVGNSNTKSGIHAYNCSGTVNITNVTIQDCGNAAVQVNGSTVVATDLKTSDNAWGGVNVDQGSAKAKTSFTLTGTGTSIAEDSKVWTELVNQSDAVIISFSDWVLIKDTTEAGKPSYSYAPKSSLSGLDDDGVSKVLATNTTDGTSTYYASLEEALKKDAVKTGDTITLLATGANETLSTAIPEGVTLVVGNGQRVTVNNDKAAITALMSSKGAIQIVAGGTVMLPNASSIESWIGANNSGARLELENGTMTYSFAAQTLTLNGTAEVPSTKTFYQHLSDDLGITMEIASSSTLNVNGTLRTVNGNATAGKASTLTVADGGTLNVSSSGLVRVSSQATLSGAGAINNSGIITLHSAGESQKATLGTNTKITLSGEGKVYSQFEVSADNLVNFIEEEVDSEGGNRFWRYRKRWNYADQVQPSLQARHIEP